MADLDDLLEKTSRTFALTIPLLPEPTRREVTIAYLLFRIADTFEDATVWPGAERIAALEKFGELLNGPESLEVVERASRIWIERPPDDRHAGYVELIGEIPFVFDLFWRLDATAKATIRKHLSRTVAGMARYVAGADGGAERLELQSLQNLRDYCYIVAGVVGEMLTDLYLAESPELAESGEFLRRRAREFGEALQLVNILKDSARDASDGRRYLPSDCSVDQVFELARRDFDCAREYVLELQGRGSARGLVAFNALPLLLARASLRRVEEEGPGAKITRPEVYAIVAEMEAALAAASPVV